MGGILAALLGGGAEAAGKGVAAPIEAVGNVLDRLFTSDDERAKAAFVMEKLKQHPAELQVELNMLDAKSESWFQKNWRSAIGWVCAVSLALFYWPQFALAAIVWVRQAWEMGALVPYPVGQISGLMELVVAMLGLGVLRSVDKITGK